MQRRLGGRPAPSWAASACSASLAAPSPWAHRCSREGFRVYCVIVAGQRVAVQWVRAQGGEARRWGRWVEVAQRWWGGGLVGTPCQHMPMSSVPRAAGRCDSRHVWQCTGEQAGRQAGSMQEGPRLTPSPPRAWGPGGIPSRGLIPRAAAACGRAAAPAPRCPQTTCPAEVAAAGAEAAVRGGK